MISKPYFSAAKLPAIANTFFCLEASKAADDYLVEKGQVKLGNYFKKVGGEFLRIDKKEGEIRKLQNEIAELSDIKENEKYASKSWRFWKK